MIIQTVYKPEETVDHLDDWLNHHTKIGVTHFYMYDNAGSTGGIVSSMFDIPSNISKSGFKHKYSGKEARDKQTEIFAKYNVTHIVWDTKDDNGNIQYNWNGAFKDFLQRVESGLCAFIDVDEFIIKRENFYESRLKGIKYKSLYEYSSVYDCYDQCIIPQKDTKCILNMSNPMVRNYTLSNNNIDSYIHFNNIDLPISKNIYNHYHYTKFRHMKYKNYYKDELIGYEKTPYKDLFVKVTNTGLIK